MYYLIAVINALWRYDVMLRTFQMALVRHETQTPNNIRNYAKNHRLRTVSSKLPGGGLRTSSNVHKFTGFSIKHPFSSFTSFLCRVMRKQCFAFAKTKAHISCTVTLHLISVLVFATKINIESIIGLRPRQGNLRQVFRIQCIQVSSEALPRKRLE